jgi:glycosyltransferase involved in cell wall biosynthesis
MRVLHIGKWDKVGGAATAGWRIHESLIAEGIESRMLVGSSQEPNKWVEEIPKRLGEQFLGKIGWHLGLNNLNRYGSFKLTEHPWFQWADVVHFNNLHNDYFSYRALPKLGKRKPLFWTFHDMWAVTGHCSYSYDCDRWQASCGSCPYPDTYPMIVRDNTSLELKLKRKAYSKTDITCITPSKWLGDILGKSILQDKPRAVIRYPVDTHEFTPLDKESARKELALPLNKLVLLSVAHSFNDPRKGGPVLIQALEQLSPEERSKIVLLLMGGETPNIDIEGLDVRATGYISENASKRTIYSAADALLFASMQDNLPLVIQESLCCGTPIVANSAGGCSEMVVHEATGLLLENMKSELYTNAIRTLLDDRMKLTTMQAQARKFAIDEYDSKKISGLYSDLFRSRM